jgi:hypothetical protein
VGSPRLDWVVIVRPGFLVLRRRGGCENIARAMSPWLSVLVPLLAMFFMLGMENVESRVCEAGVRPEEAEGLLERPTAYRRGAGLQSNRLPSRPRAPA